MEDPGEFITAEELIDSKIQKVLKKEFTPELKKQFELGFSFGLKQGKTINKFLYFGLGMVFMGIVFFSFEYIFWSLF